MKYVWGWHVSSRKLSEISVPEIRILAPSMERGLDQSPPPRHEPPAPHTGPAPHAGPAPLSLSSGSAKHDDDTSEHESAFSLQSSQRWSPIHTCLYCHNEQILNTLKKTWEPATNFLRKTVIAVKEKQRLYGVVASRFHSCKIENSLSVPKTTWRHCSTGKNKSLSSLKLAVSSVYLKLDLIVTWAVDVKSHNSTSFVGCLSFLQWAFVVSDIYINCLFLFHNIYTCSCSFCCTFIHSSFV